MDPKKRRKPASSEPAAPAPEAVQQTPTQNQGKGFGETTERDKELALADAEWKNLWDATEVIDMDKW
jgi:hypothetical protein